MVRPDQRHPALRGQKGAGELDDLKEMVRRVERALMEHDRHASEMASRLENDGERMVECSLRIERSLERLGDNLTAIAKKNGNGDGGAFKTLDLAMKIILTLVGVLAMLTLGPESIAKLFGH